MNFGWDISTSVIGATVLDENGKWIKTDHFDFSKIDAKSLHDKMDESQWWVEEFLEPYIAGSHMHYFEERLANFSAGRTMLQTLMILAGFNALFSYEVWRIHRELGEKSRWNESDPSHPEKMIGVCTTHIHPSTVKAIMKRDGLIIPKGGDKKKLTLDFVKNKIQGWEVFLNRNDNPHPYNFDRADSYITARAGYLRAYLSRNAKRAETSSDSGDAGA